MSDFSRPLRAALERLGIDQLALSIHDPSFPSDDSEETGRGTPYGRGAARLLESLAAIGFDTIQLGPQGLTHPDNPSPYDGAIFARNIASVALAPMRDAGWLSEDQCAELLGELPADRGHADHRRNRRIVERALELAAAAAGDHIGEIDSFRASNADWLERDALYEILAAEHGTGEVSRWPVIDRTLWVDEPARIARRRELLAGHDSAVARFVLQQAIAHHQHAELRERCRGLGLALAGDLQIGMAPRDAWSYQTLLWEGYRMGAPPSRTNPDGQPWGYPILDAALCGEGGPARDFVRARLGKLFREYDAVRIDHPHGWVCPWVYRADHPDPRVAVREGARLWSSPDLADHPELAALSVVVPGQLDRGRSRHDDHWVRELSPEQIEAYGRLFDELVATAGDSGQLICEVLSTQPRPLAAVLARHGLGRFRVTQKANLADPDDVYRSENAEPADWVMIGNHDTASIWELIGRWTPAELEVQARHLSALLSPAKGPPLAEWLAGSRERVAVAKLAELFCSRAQHVQVFFADLFGISERYNAPGTVGDHNWSVRLPPDWEGRYRRAAEADAALSIPRALALALRARGGDEADALAARLERLPALP